MRRRTREALLFLALMLVGATTTYVAFRPDPVRAMDAGDLKALQQDSSATPTTTVHPTRTADPSPSAGDQPTTPGSPATGPAGQGGDGSGGGTTTVPAGPTTTTTQPPTNPPNPTNPTILLTVPNVVGLGESSAKMELNNAGFVAEVSYQSRRDSCNVIEQFPYAYTQAEQGSTVYITVAQGPGPCAEA